MIRSMTGYGTADLETRAGSIRAEVKTVNHRFFSLNLRVPPTLERHEAQVRDWLRELLPRGHVSMTVRFERAGVAGLAPALALDEARATQYIDVLRTLKQRFDLPGEIDLALVTRSSGLIVDSGEAAPEVDIDDLRAITETAARAALKMREEEGRRLQADLEGRLDAIEHGLFEIEARAPARLLVERDRLRRAVAELAENIAVDEDRLAREIAFIAERWDIAEEVVRLRSHIQLFRETIAADSAEPVGKRLSFLNQEMLREANTIGSKANDAAIEHRVVSVKNEIERLREQIENVE